MNSVSITVLCLFVFLPSNSALCEDKDSADSEFFSNLDAKIDFENGKRVLAVSGEELDKLHVMAKDWSKPKTQARAWILLAIVRAPKQLDFLIEVAKDATSDDYWINLTNAIGAQVSGQEDYEKLLPLITNSKRPGYLIRYLKDAKDQNFYKAILTGENGASKFTAPIVNEFIEYQISNQLPIPKELAEAFLRKSVLRNSMGSGDSAILAAKLGFPWSLGPLATLVKKNIEEKPLPPSLKSDLENESLKSLAVCIPLAEHISKQSFGATETIKDARLSGKKFVEWWAIHLADEAYKLPE